MGNYVVTGAASGIGKAVKAQLEAEGHDVIAVDMRDVDIMADLSDSEQCQGVIAEIRQRLTHGLDGLVPCAGLGPQTTKNEHIPLVNYFAVKGLFPEVEKKSLRLSF